MKKRSLAYIPVILIVFVGGASASFAPPEQTSREATTAAVSQPRALVDQYCVTCHNKTAKIGGLALDGMDLDHVGENAAVWEAMVKKLRARYMPPIGRPRPSEEQYDGLITHLTTLLDQAGAAHPEPGSPSTLRRLNRTEYKNAIRDILALDIDVESLLPKDDSTYGFDNIDSGGLSPMLLERYVSAATKISRKALGSVGLAPDARVVVVPADLTQERHIAGLPFGTRGGTVFKHDFLRNAEYSFEIRLSRDRNEMIEGLNEPHQLVVLLDDEIIKEFTITPEERKQFNETETKAYAYIEHPADEDLKLRIPVKAGPHEVAVAFRRKPSIAAETFEQTLQANFNLDYSPRTQPAIYNISIAGPFNDSGVADTPSRKKIFSCRPTQASQESACAKEILSRLVRQTYRRPVNDVDLQLPMAAYQEGKVEGGFEFGIEKALRRILVNPSFLYRFEEAPPSVAKGAVYPLNNVALASRLSFFLWSSVPDEELLRVAESGQLSQPKVLDQQVKRMLKDPKAEALVTSFADQWLYLRNVEGQIADAELYPSFDENLRQAFRRETQLLFQYIVQEDRSVLELLTANYTFVNERLAKHYDIPNVYGSRFRKVDLPSDSIRGGILGQGSILTVTSYGNRTNPVRRGKWIMENILGAAPPPPPPNVPPLMEVDDGKVRTMRERMAAHRNNAICASCHNILDPIGLSMENFDPIGRWRDSYKGGTPIDSTGKLPDGTVFEGFTGLKQALLKRPDSFVSTLTEKLMIYATGRGLEFYDAPTVRGIVRQAREHDYRFSSLIAGVVNSAPFEMRRAQ
jgi:mono/diheme cytochrome c family protein